MFKLVNFNLRQHDRSGLAGSPDDAGRGEWLLKIEADAGTEAGAVLDGWVSVGADQAREGVAETVAAWQQSATVQKAKRLADDLRTAQDEANERQRERDRLTAAVDDALTAGRPVEALENDLVAVGIRMESVSKRAVTLRRLALEAKREALAELKAALQQRLDADRIEALEVRRLEHEGLIQAIQELLPQLCAARRLASSLSPERISETVENSLAEASAELTLPGEAIGPSEATPTSNPRQSRATQQTNWTPLRAA